MNKDFTRNELFEKLHFKTYLSKIDDFVKRWNEKIPFDKYYRDKYKIPIFSKQHLETSFFAMFCEFRQDYMESKAQKVSNEIQPEAIEADKRYIESLRAKSKAKMWNTNQNTDYKR